MSNSIQLWIISRNYESRGIQRICQVPQVVRNHDKAMGKNLARGKLKFWSSSTRYHGTCRTSYEFWLTTSSTLLPCVLSLTQQNRPQGRCPLEFLFSDTYILKDNLYSLFFKTFLIINNYYVKSILWNL